MQNLTFILCEKMYNIYIVTIEEIIMILIILPQLLQTRINIGSNQINEICFPKN